MIIYDSINITFLEESFNDLLSERRESIIENEDMNGINKYSFDEYYCFKEEFKPESVLKIELPC